MGDQNAFVRFRGSLVKDQFAIAHHFRDGLNDHVAPRREPVRIRQHRPIVAFVLTEVYSRAGRADVRLRAIVRRRFVRAVICNALVLCVDAFALSENNGEGGHEN